MVSVLDSGSSSHSAKWVQMVNGLCNGQTSYPGGTKILPITSSFRNQDKLWPDGPLDSYTDLSNLPTHCTISVTLPIFQDCYNIINVKAKMAHSTLKVNFICSCIQRLQAKEFWLRAIFLFGYSGVCNCSPKGYGFQPFCFEMNMFFGRSYFFIFIYTKDHQQKPLTSASSTK